MADPAPVDPDEYARLSDQKAEDWRTISNVAPTLFGVAGAIFAAGATVDEAWVVMMAPFPLLLGVLHMVRNAKLQLPMITFLARHRPAGSAESTWEDEIDQLRPLVWDFMAERGLSGWLGRRRGLRQPAAALAEVARPSAWNTWLLISLAVGVLANLVSAFAGYDNARVAVPVGIGALALGGLVVNRQASGIQRDRDMWRTAWNARHEGRDVKATLREWERDRRR